MRAIICDRVSSDEQAAIGRGREQRMIEMRDYCQRNTLTITEELVDDISGRVLIGDRPKGKRIMQAIAGRTCDAVVWHDVDRIGRDEDAMSLGALRRTCRDAGVELHILKSGGLVDLESMSAAIDYFKAMGAAEERRKIVERTHGGRKRKAAAGQIVGVGVPAYGHRWVGKGRDVRIEIHPDEARIIRRAYDLILGRRGQTPMSVIAVCALFDREGVPLPNATRRPNKPPKFATWYPPTLQRIVRNPAIVGHLSYSGIPIHRPDLAIVTAEEQAAVDARIRANKNESKGNRRKEYLFAKRLKCRCGRSLSGATFELSDTERRYYRCTQTAIGKAKRTCHEPFLRVDRVDAEGWAYLRRLITDDEALREGVRRHNERQAESEQPTRERIAELAQAIKTAETQLERFTRRLGIVEDEDVPGVKAEMGKCRTAIRARKAEQGDLEQRLLSAPAIDEDAIAAVVATYKPLIESADFAERRFLVERFDIRAQVVMTDEGRRVKFTCGLLDVATDNQPSRARCWPSSRPTPPR